MDKIIYFPIDNVMYGLDVKNIKEVIEIPKVSIIQDQEIYIYGLVNIRGIIVAAIDLNSLVFKVQKEKYTNMIILKQNKDDGYLGICTNEVNHVIEIEPNEYLDVPKNIKKELKKYVNKVCKWKNSSIKMIDVEQLYKLRGEKHEES